MKIAGILAWACWRIVVIPVVVVFVTSLGADAESSTHVTALGTVDGTDRRHGSAEVGIARWAAGEILVRLRSGESGAGKKSAAWLDLNRRYGVHRAEILFEAPRGGRGHFSTASPGTWLRLELKDNMEPRKVAQDYADLPMVSEAQPNYLRRPAMSPNDSLYGVQWNLQAMGWDTTPDGGADVVVAIVDSGIDSNHPDLVRQMWLNHREVDGEPGVDDDANGYIDDLRGWDFSDAPGLPGKGDYLGRDNDPNDESGHGTHVAGIIAATTNNHMGIAGLAPTVRLMGVRAGFNLPSGTFFEDDDLAAGIVYAADNGADVINMSWGDPHFSPLLLDAVNYAEHAGCVMVAASGNEGSDEVYYPARLHETIAVTATDAADRVLAFSNAGASIDVAAPGQSIWSLVAGGGYAQRSGTSMAAAHVSGLAALVLSRRPHFIAGQVRSTLTVTARDLGPRGWDPKSGAGLVQVEAAWLDRVPEIQFKAPAFEAVVQDSVLIRVWLGGHGIDSFELNWSRENEPWNRMPFYSIAKPTNGPLDAVWHTKGLQHGRYLLEAAIKCDDMGFADRVSVILRRRGPTVIQPRLSHLLDRRIWRYVVEWDTDVPTTGEVDLRSVPGGDGVVVPASPRQVHHRVVLPSSLYGQTYDIAIRARSGAEETVLALPQAHLAATNEMDLWNMRLLRNFPDGYLMPEFSDFNNDGWGEMVLMRYGGRSYYNAGEFFQLGDGYPRLYSTQQLFVPWAACDINGDGKAEVMAVDAQRVRLIEASEVGGFPDLSVWDRSDVWGGETADIDGDGRPEMFLRSARGDNFQVFEADPAGTIEARTLLASPVSPAGEIENRQIVADLDGDSRGELLAIADGRAFVYEAIGDDAYRTTWRSGASPADDGVVGGGADCDGDGKVEFVVARLNQDTDFPRRTRWQVIVYEPDEDNVFRPEWQISIEGGKRGGNGIQLADMNGDGLLEIILALPPQLYLLASTGVDTYEPVWYAEAGNTHRPASGDANGDGVMEFAFNSPQGIGLYSLLNTALGSTTFERFSVTALDSHRVFLEWGAVSGAGGYNVLRDGEVRFERTMETKLEDIMEEDRDYRYQVVALDSIGDAEGPRSAILSVNPETPSRIEAVERITPRHLAVLFSRMMDPEQLAEEGRYVVDPFVGRLSSVVVDRDSRRAVLAFDDVLPDSGLYTLRFNGLTSLAGTPLPGETFDFALAPVATSARVIATEVVSPVHVQVHFSERVFFGAGEVRATFADSLFRLREISLLDSVTVVLFLDATTPLRALGRSYQLRLEGLTDVNGTDVESRVVLDYVPQVLEHPRIFPNPFFPRRGLATFAGLPPGAVVTIYDFNGQLVRSLEERSRNGGVTWDGTNAEGKPLAGGIYLFSVHHSVMRRTGKFALFAGN